VEGFFVFPTKCGVVALPFAAGKAGSLEVPQEASSDPSWRGRGPAYRANDSQEPSAADLRGERCRSNKPRVPVCLGASIPGGDAPGTGLGIGAVGVDAGVGL